MLKDPRDEPQYAERVPYLISNSTGRRLIDRARMPEEMLKERSLDIDAEYYIRNLLVPPLARIFNLVGGDVEQWYRDMPRKKRVRSYGGARGSKIDAHFVSSHCFVCGGDDNTNSKVCRDCRAVPDMTAHALLSREHVATTRLSELHQICASCSNTPLNEAIMCGSIDCPVTYARTAAERDADDTTGVRGLIADLEW
jgi:DNA polymerase zeta